MAERIEEEVVVSKVVKEQYIQLQEEARKQAREAAENVPKREAQISIWTDRRNNAIHWKVKCQRNPLTKFLLVVIPPLWLLLPFLGFYKTWAKGRIPLPRKIKAGL